jgi:hypothetical protein
MPSPLFETPDALEAAIAASLQARRDKLIRSMRNRRIGMRIVFVLSQVASSSPLRTSPAWPLEKALEFDRSHARPERASAA